MSIKRLTIIVFLIVVWTGISFGVGVFAHKSGFLKQVKEETALRTGLIKPDWYHFYQEQYQAEANLYRKRSEELEKERAHFWHRSYDDIESYLKSVRPNREELARLLRLPKQKIALEPAVSKYREKATHTVYRASFNSQAGIRVDGFLLIPKGGKKPFPAVIAVTGHGSFPPHAVGLAEKDYSEHFGVKLVQRGYVVFSPFIVNSFQKRYMISRMARLCGGAWEGLEIQRIISSVDFLTTLPQVDAHRIGIYGISLGGFVAFWSAAVDTRIKVAVVSGWFASNTKRLLDEDVLRDPYYNVPDLPGMLTMFESSDIGSLIAPRPLFIENGEKDGVTMLYDPYKQYALLKEIYSRLGMEHRLTFKSYDGGHKIYGTDSLDWLDRHLQESTRSSAVDEQTVSSGKKLHGTRLYWGLSTTSLRRNTA